MMNLSTLRNSTRPFKKSKRVGRGIGSGKGKTCGRGEKGAGSRSGYKRRLGKEGGNMPLFMKTPIRGFNNARFRRELHVVNLNQLEFMFEEGETVNLETLKERGFISGPSYGVKLLGTGTLTKKLKIQVHSISDGAREKLTQAKIAFEVTKLAEEVS
jgi:large subunit ribosomal protein L15